MTISFLQYDVKPFKDLPNLPMRLHRLEILEDDYSWMQLRLQEEGVHLLKKWLISVT